MAPRHSTGHFVPFKRNKTFPDMHNYATQWDNIYQIVLTIPRCRSTIDVHCYSIAETMDQGIIRAIKARYSKHLMVHLLAKMDDNLSANKLANSITVLDAVNWVSAAWEDTKPSTLISCFKHCGFPTPTTELDEDPEDDLPLASFISQVTQHPLEPEAFINIDECVSPPRTLTTGRQHG